MSEDHDWDINYDKRGKLSKKIRKENVSEYK